MRGEQHGYLKTQLGWAPKECPSCNLLASYYGLLFSEPPPPSPYPDRREPIGEVYMHNESKDCVIHFKTNRETSALR